MMLKMIPEHLTQNHLGNFIKTQIPGLYLNQFSMGPRKPLSR